MTFKLMVNVAKKGLALQFKSSLLKRNFNLPLKTNVTLGDRQWDPKDLSKIRICGFHKTSPNQALPPLFVLAVRIIAKIGTVMSGRIIRKWWQKLTPEEKEVVLMKIRSKKSKIAAAAVVFAGALFIFYIEHITEDPITKRKRFIMLNQKQINQVAEFEYQQQLKTFSREIVPSYHPIHRRVSRVINTLLLSNKDLKEIRDKVWSVTVIDRPDITNAFALPQGKIFVFTGMLNICTSDDQLAIVLAHEISHSILSHVAESMSKIFLVEFILLIPSLFFWIIFPDSWAIFSEWIASNLAKVFIHLPFSRSIEKEADMVGLQLAAKSCYDVREAPIFWAKMKILNTDFPVEWLSTHPTHQSRQMELQELLPYALEIREKNSCPPLNSKLGRW